VQILNQKYGSALQQIEPGETVIVARQGNKFIVAMVTGRLKLPDGTTKDVGYCTALELDPDGDSYWTKPGWELIDCSIPPSPATIDLLKRIGDWSGSGSSERPSGAPTPPGVVSAVPVPGDSADANATAAFPPRSAGRLHQHVRQRRLRTRVSHRRLPIHVPSRTARRFSRRALATRATKRGSGAISMGRSAFPSMPSTTTATPRRSGLR
jgi:hypothetical protein